jgi:hypothetical protein
MRSDVMPNQGEITGIIAATAIHIAVAAFSSHGLHHLTALSEFDVRHSEGSHGDGRSITFSSGNTLLATLDK